MVKNTSNNKLSFQICITIVKGERLIGKDTNWFSEKTSDPYARVYFPPKIYLGKTDLKQKTCNPSWDKVELRPERVTAKEANRGIRVRIFDYDVYTKDDFMGEVDIPLNLSEDPTDTTTELWYQVGTGEVNCPDYYCHNATGRIKVKIEISQIRGFTIQRGTKIGGLGNTDDDFQVTLQWNIDDTINF